MCKYFSLICYFRWVINVKNIEILVSYYFVKNILCFDISCFYIDQTFYPDALKLKLTKKKLITWSQWWVETCSRTSNWPHQRLCLESDNSFYQMLRLLQWMPSKKQYQKFSIETNRTPASENTKTMECGNCKHFCIIEAASARGAFISTFWWSLSVNRQRYE